MSDLTEFLLARIAEDEDVAHRCLDAVDGDRTEFGQEMARRVGPYSTVTSSSHCGQDMGPRGSVEATPGRVLAECEAKRRIVASLDMTPCPCQRADRCVIHDASAASPEFAVERYVDPVTETVLRSLALPYADHPSYDEAWRP